jgi:hypothetical protein
VHGEKNKNVSDAQIRHESAHGFELVNTPDMLHSFGAGTYAGRLTVVDPFSQKITVNNVSSAVLFDKTKHLNKYSYLQLSPDRTQHSATEHYEAFFRVSANKLNPENWVIQRNSYISGLHGFQLKVDMPGNTILKAGKVVTVNFPSLSTPTREAKPIDELYGGNYLITAVRHKIDRTKYTSTLELSKDSVKTPMPKAVTINPAFNKIRAL